MNHRDVVFVKVCSSVQMCFHLRVHNPINLGNVYLAWLNTFPEDFLS